MTLYLKHFGMREAPFKITPTTEFFYGGGRRGEILHAMQYAIEVGEGIMMITGEVGSGKTMLLRTLSEKLSSNVELVYIANPTFSGRAILYNICEELELDIDAGRPGALRLLQNYLIDRHAQGRKVVALIDEAQAMPDESLEEIRLLSNLETSRSKLLQIAMFGQPELTEKLENQNMRQLRERITVQLNLEPFGRDDIREYISTRLHAAGYNGGELFAKDGCHLLAVVSQGLSRRINVLADKALLSAFERGADRVTYDDVRRAVKDAKFGRMRYKSERARRTSRQLTIGVSIAACAVLAVAVVSRTGSPPTELAPSVEVQAAAGQTSPQNDDQTAADATTAVVTTEPEEVQTDEALTNENLSTSDLQTDSDTSFEHELQSESQSESRTRTPGEELLAVIAEAQRGEINSEQLGEDIALLAEPHHETASQPGRGDASWQSSTIRDAGLVDNEKWGWMPDASYLRLRLNATETWMQDAPDTAYTARLLTVGQERSELLERFLRHFADFYPLRNLMVYPLRLGDRDRFVVTFGVYPTRDDARVFIDNMPRYFIGGKPFAQQVSASISEAEAFWQ